MPAAGGARSISDFERRVVDPAVPGTFSRSELDGLPDPVRRYFSASIAPGTGLARSAGFRMRGSIKLGSRWLRSTVTRCSHRTVASSGRHAPPG